jgi:hypothetical protein
MLVRWMGWVIWIAGPYEVSLRRLGYPVMAGVRAGGYDQLHYSYRYSVQARRKVGGVAWWNLVLLRSTVLPQPILPHVWLS